MKGWKGPCYLITDAHYETFEELMTKTPWENYGHGNDPRCENCMVHCGYEPSAVAATFGTWRGFLATARMTLFGLPEVAPEPASVPPKWSSHGAAPDLPLVPLELGIHTANAEESDDTSLGMLTENVAS